VQVVKKYFLYFLILVYVSGAIGFLINPGFFSPFTPFTLVFTCFVFLMYQPVNNLNFTLSFVALALIGFFAELIGVKTGAVFGNYYYGNALGYKIWGVPLVISLNWGLLINVGVLVATYLSSKPLLIAAIAAFVITGVDLLIEQVASKMDYWYFSEGIAGFQNYAGWFIISFFASLGLQKHLAKGDKRTAFIFLVLQLFFFGLIYINKLFNFVTA
jgi:putative membrane protein